MLEKAVIWGRERIDIIEPALEQLRQARYSTSWALPLRIPYSSLSISTRIARCCACDVSRSGLPVLKYEGFGRAVNITRSGLPFIRTSVDHGTAL